MNNVRVEMNTNLSRWHNEEYNGMPVLTGNGPCITEYLHKTHQVINTHLAYHNRVFAIRLDLRFPSFVNTECYSSDVMNRFICSFRAKLKHAYQSALRQGRRGHEPGLRYLWARELGQDGHPHYHLLLLLNRDAYFTLGDMRSSEGTLYSKLNSAWATALGIEEFDTRGLVNVAGTFHWKSGEDIGPLFQAASYMCKEHSKEFGIRQHAFGSSRG